MERQGDGRGRREKPVIQFREGHGINHLPISVYFDFETLNKKVEEVERSTKKQKSESYTEVLTEQPPISFGLHIVSE